MKKKSGWTRLAGQGFELTGAVLGFVAVGYWIGRHFGKAEIGLLIGAVLGIVGGLYNLIRTALKEVNRQSQSIHEESEP